MCDYLITSSSGYLLAEPRPCGNLGHHHIGGLALCDLHVSKLQGGFDRQDDCPVLLSNGSRCRKPAIEPVADLLCVCGWHRERLTEWAFGEVGLVNERHARVREDQAAAKRHKSIVYYVQGDDELIKIGFTTNFRKRLPALQSEYQRHGKLVLLGWHRGHSEAEKAMHRRFADDRVEGEWFLASDELLGHIRLLQRRNSGWPDDLVHHDPVLPKRKCKHGHVIGGFCDRCENACRNRPRPRAA